MGRERGEIVDREMPKSDIKREEKTERKRPESEVRREHENSKKFSDDKKDNKNSVKHVRDASASSSSEDDEAEARRVRNENEVEDGKDCDKDKKRGERSDGHAKDTEEREKENYSRRAYSGKDYDTKDKESKDDGNEPGFDYQTILYVSVATLAGFALVAYLCFCGKSDVASVDKELPSQQDEFVEVKVHFGGTEEDVNADIVTTSEGTDTTLCKLSGTTKALEGRNSSTVLVE